MSHPTTSFPFPRFPIRLAPKAILPTRSTTAPTTTTTTTHTTSFHTSLTLLDALDDAANQLPPQTTPHVAIVFVSSLYGLEQLQRVVPVLTARYPSIRHIIGSTGYGIIGTPPTPQAPQEIEQEPALSLTLASLPHTTVTATHVSTLPDADAPPSAWHALLNTTTPPVTAQSPTTMIILADPTYPLLPDLIAGINYAFPTATVLGGLSSADQFNLHRRALLYWSADAPASPTHTYNGAVVLTLQGGIHTRHVLSQGCTPLANRVYTIEQADDNIILLASSPDDPTPRPPLELLRHALATVPPSAIVAQNLLTGIWAPFTTDTTTEPVVRPIIGVVPSSGALALGDTVSPGQLFKFMVRDADSARTQLAQRMAAVKREALQRLVDDNGPTSAPLAALVFSCNARGMSMYGQPNVDVGVIHEYLRGGTAVSGLMCNGELGRVGDGTVQLMGYTCSVGLVYDGITDLSTLAPSSADM